MPNKIFIFLKKYWFILSITSLGLILRLYNLTKISLWHDEAFSALLVKYSWGEMVYRIGLDVHPPLYYFALRVWHYVFGYSLFSLRLMSVAFGVGTILATYFLIKKVFNNHKAAGIAALLIAVNPFAIQYVTEARMYTMGSFLAIVSAYFLYRALTVTKSNFLQTTENKLRSWHYYIIFMLLASAAIYTHYYLIFTVGMLGLYGLIFCIIKFKTSFKYYLPLLFSGFGILILFLPWLKIFMFQLKQVGAGYWIPPINIWSIPQTLFDLTIRIGQPSKIIMVFVTVFIIFVIYKVLKHYQETEKHLIIFAFLAPFIGALLFAILAKIQGSNSSVFLVRYFLFASPFLLALVALWLETIKIYGLKQILLSIIIVLNLFSTVYYWQQLQVNKKTGMAGLAKVINANVQISDKLFVASSFQFFNFKYYNQTGVKPLLYTNNSKVENLPHFAGTAILTNEDLVLNFESAAQSGDTVWMIWTNGFGGSKPDVPKNWKQVDEQGFAEVRPYVGTWVIATQYKVQ